MGQSLSGDQDESNDLPDDLLRQARQLAEVATLSYEEFQDDLAKLNELSQQCMDAEGKQLVFAVKEGSDSNVFWKGTIRIACVKMDPATKSVENYRILNLNQFLKVYRSVSGQCAAAQAVGTPKNVPRPRAEAKCDSSDSEASGECCICLERSADMLLPCAHSYCRVCIEQWSVNHKTCPICREEASKDEAWVLSEGPDSLEVSEEICATLMELMRRQTSTEDSDNT